MLRPPVEPQIVPTVIKALYSRAKKGLFNALALPLEKLIHRRNIRNGHASANHNNRSAVTVPQGGEIMWHLKVQRLGLYLLVPVSSEVPT